MIDEQKVEVTEFLKGLNVAEFGDGLAGAATGAGYVALGATVTRYRWSDGEESRSGGFPSESPLNARRRQLLGANKTLVHLSGSFNEALDALSRADLVIVDLMGSDVEVSAANRAEYVAEVARIAKRAWVSISPFGLEGPYGDFRGDNLICSAAGGALAGSRTAKDHRPVGLAGEQALLSAADIAVLAGLHGLDLNRESNEPMHLDVSVQEAVITDSELLAVSVELLNSKAGGSGRAGPPRGAFRCRDGFVDITVVSPSQWVRLIRALGEPDWAEHIKTTDDRFENAEMINREVSDWTRQFTKTECAERLQHHGVPAAPVNTPSDLIQSRGLIERGFFEKLKVPGKDEIVGCRSPIRLSDDGPDLENPASEHSGRMPTGGIRGLRVLECGHVLALPFAGALLGAMGADVLRMDDLGQPDLYLANKPYIDMEEGIGRSCYYVIANLSKRRIAFDVEKNPATLASLVTASDVVLENWGAARARKSNVASDSPREGPRPTLAVSSSGFGHEGPYGPWKAYAHTIHAFSGATNLIWEKAGERAEIEGAWADLKTGINIATAVAAWALGNRPVGKTAIDLSMAEVAVKHIQEYLSIAVDRTALNTNDQTLWVGGGVDDVPNGVYATDAGAAWIAVAVDGDLEWERFCEVTQDHRILGRSEFQTVESRVSRRVELESIIGRVLYAANAEDLFLRLQSVGVRACPVWTGKELCDNPQLLYRRFFRRISNVTVGSRRIVGLPWSFVGEERVSLYWGEDVRADVESNVSIEWPTPSMNGKFSAD
jgi:crotonobetainyl-CoA:carnitine CoA-transferase CaiB-like acyl-CoA transferase